MVSVIVPTRNSARTLEACLSSIRAQNGTKPELIVVDNESTDGTGDIAARLADVVVRWGPERSAQRNHGAAIAKGEFLLFVDSDMILEPNVVSDCVAVIDQTAASAVIVPEVSIGQGFWAACRALERSCYAGDDTIEAARFFPREVFNEVGGFDESLTGPEDWDLTIRVAAERSLPRAASTIIHDEGDLRLGTALAKKGYYAVSMVRYWRRHGGRAVLQGNLALRPAFARNWRRLLRRPLLAAGVLSLKCLEAMVIGWAIGRELIRGRAVGVAGKP